MKLLEAEVRTIDSYITEAKVNIFIYFVVYFVLCFGVFVLAYIEKTPFICIFSFYFFLRFLQRVFIYRKIKNIKKRLEEQGLLDKAQNIIFWNQNHYFLTEENFVIFNKKSIDIFSYQDIQTIQKEIHYHFGSATCPPDFLYLTLNNGKKYQILIRFNQSHFSLEEDLDISEFLLSKNKAIVEEELIIKVYDKKI